MNRLRAAVVVVVLCGVASACAPSEDPFEIQFRRVALDLAFKDAAKAAPKAPVSPRVIVEQLPVDDYVLEQLPEEPEVLTPQRRVITLPPPPSTPPCDPAPPGATPAVPAFHVVKDPPKPGVYTRHNTGSLQIDLGPTSLGKLPYPPKTTWTIDNVKSVPASAYLSSEEAAALPQTARDNDTAFPDRREFTLTRTSLRGFSVTDTFRYSQGGTTGGDFLWLVKRETVANGAKSVFTPTPPIRYVELFVPEGTDSEVHHAGIDRTTNQAMVVQSKLVTREWIDVCGEVVDTYRVEIKENVVDLSRGTPQQSGNGLDQATIWNIIFDNGLLIVREEVKATQRTTREFQGTQVPVTVTYDYVSTLDSLEPKPPDQSLEPTLGQG